MLVGVLSHSRPEALRECLKSIRPLGMKARIVIHQDGDDKGCDKVLLESQAYDHIIHSHERVGIAAGLNKILQLRDPGEDFVRVDGDVTFLTPGWLQKLSDGRRDQYGLLGPLWTGNTWEQATRDLLTGKTNPPYIETFGAPLGGVVFHPGKVVDKLGGYRSWGKFYGCQERDYAARVRALGYQIAYLTSVRIAHPPVPPLRGERREETEEALKKLKRKIAADYSRGEDLYVALAPQGKSRG